MNTLIISTGSETITDSGVTAELVDTMKKRTEEGWRLLILTNYGPHEANVRRPHTLDLPEEFDEALRDVIKRNLIEGDISTEDVMNCIDSPSTPDGGIDWDAISTFDLLNVAIDFNSSEYGNERLIEALVGEDYETPDTLEFFGKYLDITEFQDDEPSSIEILCPDIEEALGLFGMSVLCSNGACVKIHNTCAYTKDDILEYMDAAIMD